MWIGKAELGIVCTSGWLLKVMSQDYRNHMLICKRNRPGIGIKGHGSFLSVPAQTGAWDLELTHHRGNIMSYLLALLQQPWQAWKLCWDRQIYSPGSSLWIMKPYATGCLSWRRRGEKRPPSVYPNSHPANLMIWSNSAKGHLTILDLFYLCIRKKKQLLLLDPCKIPELL